LNARGNSLHRSARQIVERLTMATATLGPEPWPMRPPPEVFRLCDRGWNNLKELYHLPDTTLQGADSRALLEWEFYNAREAIRIALGADPVRVVRNQIGRIARSRPGKEMPKPLSREVAGLLAGRALGDPTDFAKHRVLKMRLQRTPTVTPELRKWARECKWLGAGRRSRRRIHGGGANAAEQDFVCVLLYFWEKRLGRRITNWEEGPAAPLTRFVVECLELAGAQNLAGAQAPEGGAVTIQGARHRIRRAAADLPWET
jgi:hypothetical protein